MANVTIKQIRAFVSAAENGSFTRAAIASHMSQSAFTRIIHDLEYEVKIKLFDRASHGMELSDAGVEFLGAARTMLNHYSVTIERLKLYQLGNGRSLTVTMSDATAGVVLPLFGTTLKKAFPAITLSAVSGTSEKMLDMMSTGKSDIGFGALPLQIHDVHKKLILKARVGLLISKRYVAFNGIATVADLMKINLVKYAGAVSLNAIIAEHIPQLDVECEATATAANFMTMMGILHSGIAGALVSSLSASHPWARELDFIPLPTPIYRDIYLFSSANLPAAARLQPYTEILEQAIRAAPWHSSTIIVPQSTV